MKTFMVFVLGLVVFVGDSWAGFSEGDDRFAEERWDEYGTNDDGTWWGITNGVRYEGVSVCSSQSGTWLEMQYNIDTTYGFYCWCKITSPFDGKYVYSFDYVSMDCINFCECGGETIISGSGFPILSKSLMELHNALLNSQKEKPAACYLKTSTGVSLPLYDVKSTSPALHVLRDGVIYYGNMELGQGTNTLNVDYNGVIYHLVE